MIELETPTVDELTEVVAALRDWQVEGDPIQLHPGDLGWSWREGDAETAATVRIWKRAGEPVAIGMLDAPDILRIAFAPSVKRDGELAERIRDDLVDPGRGVFAAGRANVETPSDAMLGDVLGDVGWGIDEPWTPLHRSLADPIEDPGLRTSIAGPADAELRAELQRAGFGKSQFTADNWRTMAATPAYRDARCLIGFDSAGDAVATITVWSAGPGRPAMIEPMSVHADYRGHGYGRAICVAAAATARDLGSSSVMVCTPTSLAGAVATYKSAGFTALHERFDRYRAD